MFGKIILVVTFLGVSTASCPDEQIVHPCICKDNSISCSNINTEFHLKEIFDKINSAVTTHEKHWDTFHMDHTTTIEELPANVFGEITFESIVLLNNPNLVYVHPLAFMRSSFTLKRFIVENTPLSNAGDKEKDIFDALSRCPDLIMIRLIKTNLTSIPNNAFHPINGDFNHLTAIYTDGSPIKSIGEFAFFHMPNLSELDMNQNNFTLIKKNTFAFEKRSEVRLQIFLQDVPLTETSFDALSLTLIRRPVIIRLFYNKIHTLYESIFQPFLELNTKNVIDIEGNPIQCDCKIKWILDEKERYYSQIAGASQTVYNCVPHDC